MNKTTENTTEKQRFWWSDVAIDIRDNGRTYVELLRIKERIYYDYGFNCNCETCYRWRPYVSLE